jgi:hypothetical protein
LEQQTSFIFDRLIRQRLLILADKRIPKPAFKSLKKYVDVVSFETTGITYPAISGHPDIFFCRVGSDLVFAPNIPDTIRQKLKESTISIQEGIKAVASSYPKTAIYNAVTTCNFLIHNLKFTDPLILKLCNYLEKIDVKQAYTRCNLLALKNNRFITSDKGIEKVLLQKDLEVLYVHPNGILLPGFDHGFFGGTCGIFEEKVFFIGNLNHFREGEKVRKFLSGYEIVELYDGPLFDGGSLFFVD